MVDLPKRLAEIKQRFGGAKLIIDATFATPINQRPLELGADLVIHSCTKYLGGHNDLLAGVVCGNEGLVSAIRDLRSMLGAVLDAAQRLPAAARDQDAGPAGGAAERVGAAHRPLAGGAARRSSGCSTRACPAIPTTPWPGRR